MRRGGDRETTLTIATISAQDQVTNGGPSRGKQKAALRAGQRRHSDMNYIWITSERADRRFAFEERQTKVARERTVEMRFRNHAASEQSSSGGYPLMLCGGKGGAEDAGCNAIMHEEGDIRRPAGIRSRRSACSIRADVARQRRRTILRPGSMIPVRAGVWARYTSAPRRVDFIIHGDLTRKKR